MNIEVMPHAYTAYTSNIEEASTFRCTRYAQEAIAELDDCELGYCRYHERNERGDGKIVLKRMRDGMFLSSDIGNKYSPN